MVDQALNKKYDYKIEQNSFSLKGFWRLLEAPRYLWRLWLFSQKQSSFLIRTFQSAFFPFKGKGLTIIYHIDSTGSPFLPKVFQDLLEKWFFLIIPKSERIVVIAEYWKQYLLNRGYKNIHLIYCGYDLSMYQPSQNEVEQFLTKYNLHGKKLIYIGNPQAKKGAKLVYDALKDSDYTLITSGVADSIIPCLHLDVSFKEYVCLLKAASVVVAMSLFKEGWNRVVHEAMLVGTPVVGSGAGGMEEPLLGGGQIVCKSPLNIKECVTEALSKAPIMIKTGREYAQQFSKERFEKEWQDLLSNLTR